MPYADFKNRIKNNNQAARFVGNLELIKLKKQSRLLTGKNVIKLIPDIKEIIKRDLTSELRFEYEHATSKNPGWNIFKREPRKWVNYIINMSNCLLLSKGIAVKKQNISNALSKHCPTFNGINYVKKAIQLRKTKKILDLNNIEIKKLKNDGLSEDLAKTAEADVQKVTDGFIAKVDHFIESKEKDINFLQILITVRN